jgi:hypothetical protein
MKSPTSGGISLKNIDELKHMKKKYEEVKQAVISKK